MDDNKDNETDYKAEAEKKTKEAQENYEKWLYSRAELENFKKRAHKEKITIVKYGHEHFARELLGITDALEQALLHAHQSKEKMNNNIEQGVQLTLNQFRNVFAQFGIVPIESVGKKFDPNFHQAEAEEAFEGYEPGIIIRENRKGYLLYDRLLRAAHVIVAKQKS